jgi:hypothetical protein
MVMLRMMTRMMGNIMTIIEVTSEMEVEVVDAWLMNLVG